MLLVILTVSPSAARRAASSAAIVLTRLSSAANAASASALAKALARAVNFMALTPGSQPSPRAPWLQPLDSERVAMAGLANQIEAAEADRANRGRSQRPG